MSVKSIESAKQFLDKKSIPYEEKDGKIVTQDTLRIENDNLIDGKLPDLSDVDVGGSFIVNNTNIATLIGSPLKIHGNCHIKNNIALTDLKGMTQKIGGDVHIVNNIALTSLEGMTQEVNGEVLVEYSNLTSLKGMAHAARKDILVVNNESLTSLEGMTQEAGGDILVRNNEALVSLYGITSQFKNAFIENNPLLGSQNRNYKNVQDLMDAINSQLSGFAEKVWKAAALKLNPHAEISDDNHTLTIRKKRKQLVNAIVASDSALIEGAVKQLKDIYQDTSSNEMQAGQLANEDKQVIQEAKANAMMSNMGLVQHSGGRSVG